MGEMLEKNGRHAVACLRQHYLDQVLGSPAFRAELSAFVVRYLPDGRLAPRYPKG